MIAVSLALGSSLIYGFSDFLGGLKSRSLPLLSVLLVSQGSAALVLALVVVMLGEAPPAGEFMLYAALAGLSEAAGVAALYRGLATGVMSVVAPVAALSPVFPVLAAVVIGELPTTGQGAGILLAVTGVGLLSLSGSAQPAGAGIAPSVMFGLLTALGFGGFQVAMDAASEGDIAWALLIARLTAVSAFVAVLLATRPALSVERGEVPPLVLIGVLIIAADALYAVASTKGLLSVVAVLSALYPVVTVALARIYLRERLERPQRVGAVIALGGAVAISALPA